MKVLIISANLLPVTPSGSAYIAGAAIKAGHQWEGFSDVGFRTIIKVDK